MKLEKDIRLCLFVIFCLILNCGGKALAELFKLPLWLDAVGTVFAAYMMLKQSNRVQMRKLMRLILICFVLVIV